MPDFLEKSFIILISAIVSLICILIVFVVSYRKSNCTSSIIVNEIVFIYAIACIIFIVSHDKIVKYNSSKNPLLLMTFVAPLFILIGEIQRTRDFRRDFKDSQKMFAPLRASVLLSSVGAALALLKNDQNKKLLVTLCLVTASSLIPLTSAPPDSRISSLMYAFQRSTTVSLTWLVCAYSIQGIYAT